MREMLIALSLGVPLMIYSIVIGEMSVNTNLEQLVWLIIGLATFAVMFLEFNLVVAALVQPCLHNVHAHILLCLINATDQGIWSTHQHSTRKDTYERRHSIHTNTMHATHYSCLATIKLWKRKRTEFVLVSDILVVHKRSTKSHTTGRKSLCIPCKRLLGCSQQVSIPCQY